MEGKRFILLFVLATLLHSCTAKYIMAPAIAIPNSWISPKTYGRYQEISGPKETMAPGDIILSPEDFRKVITNQKTCDSIRRGLVDLILQLQDPERQELPRSGSPIRHLTTPDNNLYRTPGYEVPIPQASANQQ